MCVVNPFAVCTWIKRVGFYVAGIVAFEIEIQEMRIG